MFITSKIQVIFNKKVPVPFSKFFLCIMSVCLVMSFFLLLAKKLHRHLLVFHDRGLYYIETSPLICSSDQSTGFCMSI